MGMTDKQFDAYTRDFIFSLKLALKENPDSEVLKELLAHYQAILED